MKNTNLLCWNSSKKSLDEIPFKNILDLSLLYGLDEQISKIKKNTQNFLEGYSYNHALLWGVRGSGKSSIIRGILSEFSKTHEFTTLEVNSEDISDLNKIFLNFNFKNKIVIFIDDLSFEKIDSDYKIIKSTLDGSIQNQPTNILLYVSSNRRHLMPRDMIDNERSSAIHTDESVEEKISLSDRFGLWIGFHKLSQTDYLKIIETYCQHYKINYHEEIRKKAIQWSLQRGNRTGRTAWQFILNTASEQNLKIKI